MWLFNRREAKRRKMAAMLYENVIAASRRPFFYDRWGVADTLDGRFDLLCLHAFLLLRRLKAIRSAESAELSQAVFDNMFADMDASLRQLGVSDLKVGQQVKSMAKAFYGRIEAYEAGLDHPDDPTRLQQALWRNIFRGQGRPTEAASLAAYVYQADAALARQADDALLSGLAVFPATEKLESLSQ